MTLPVVQGKPLQLRDDLTDMVANTDGIYLFEAAENKLMMFNITYKVLG